MGEEEGVRQACRNTNLYTSSRLGFFFFLTEEIYLFNDFSLAESDMVFPSLCTHFLGLKSTIHTSQHEMCRRGSHAEFTESKTLPVIPPRKMLPLIIV